MLATFTDDDSVSDQSLAAIPSVLSCIEARERSVSDQSLAAIPSAVTRAALAEAQVYQIRA